MLTELTRGKWWKFGWGRPIVIEVSTDSDVDTLVTLSTPTGQLSRITSVDVHYSAPVSLDITVTLRSGAGAAWDTVQAKITLASEQDWHLEMDGDRFLSDSDVLEVLAPAGGVGVTGAVSVYREVF